MKRIILIAVVSAVLLATACGRDTLDEALAERLGEGVDAGGGSRIDPQALTDFDWDKLWVFGPYTPGEVVEETIGFSWGPADHAAPLTEGQYLYVFVLGDKVVRHALAPGDSEPLVRDEPWEPGDVFIVQDATDAWGPRTVVVPIDASSP